VRFITGLLFPRFGLPFHGYTTACPPLLLSTAGAAWRLRFSWAVALTLPVLVAFLEMGRAEEWSRGAERWSRSRHGKVTVDC
jgi:hypothetical protein